MPKYKYSASYKLINIGQDVWKFDTNRNFVTNHKFLLSMIAIETFIIVVQTLFPRCLT
jgi:hypothetical protein